MNCKSLLTIILYFLFFNNIKADTISLNNDISIKKTRLSIVGSGVALSFVGTYYYIENVWWSDQSSAFHFD